MLSIICLSHPRGIHCLFYVKQTPSITVIACAVVLTLKRFDIAPTAISARLVAKAATSTRSNKRASLMIRRIWLVKLERHLQEKQGEIEKGKANNFAVSFSDLRKDVVNVLDFMERLKNEKDIMTGKRQEVDNLLRPILDDVDNTVRCKYNMDHVLPSLIDNIDKCISSCHHSTSSATTTNEQLNFLLLNLHHMSKYRAEKIFPLETQYEILQNDFIHHDKLFDLLSRVGALIREVSTLVHDLEEKSKNKESTDETSRATQYLLKNIELLKEDVKYVYLKVPDPCQWSFPMSDGPLFMHPLHKHLTDLLDSDAYSISLIKEEIELIKLIREEVSNLPEEILKNKSLVVVNTPKNPVERKSLTTGKIIVGFKEETNWLISKLTSGPKDLDVISITVVKGSRIILTTRQKEVAFHEKGNADPLNLRLLSSEESWELLEKRTFGKESFPNELLDVGKDIVQNCKGLPLVVDLITGVIAGLEKTKSVWLEVRNNLNSFILNSEVDVIKVIELSYDHLPHHMKPCFLYLASYPKDKEIHRDGLKTFWHAEGLVERTEMKSLEEVMEIYLDNLISSSLVIAFNEIGDQPTCQLHDLVHEFCLIKAKEEKLFEQISSSDLSSSSHLMPRMVRIDNDKEHFERNNFILFSSKMKRHSDIETTIAVARISMPDLPPNFFTKDAIFSIGLAVGKPLTVDMATKNHTRPSCARVKVEVDLVAKLPQRIRINEENEVTEQIKSKWVQIQYDYMPKYCTKCFLQGHDEASCWNKHPELYDKQKEESKEAETKVTERE
ncbi:hypothetical protein CQW23_30701 [Capsicum baccatum]|uniref:NB-ARC domain-containing protein n=1 Tax=Capsicum baccatum TaxID=33114 RepID=A0A2G2V9Q5_CAPBA|nr:hypothetical protein CQW23_30701 [Capsicum baccatum]